MQLPRGQLPDIPISESHQRSPRLLFMRALRADAALPMVLARVRRADRLRGDGDVAEIIPTDLA